MEVASEEAGPFYIYGLAWTKSESCRAGITLLGDAGAGRGPGEPAAAFPTPKGKKLCTSGGRQI